MLTLSYHINIIYFVIMKLFLALVATSICGVASQITCEPGFVYSELNVKKEGDNSGYNIEFNLGKFKNLRQKFSETLSISITEMSGGSFSLEDVCIDTILVESSTAITEFANGNGGDAGGGDGDGTGTGSSGGKIPNPNKPDRSVRTRCFGRRDDILKFTVKVTARTGFKGHLKKMVVKVCVPE